jgi:probable addiction module antidote protein
MPQTFDTANYRDDPKAIAKYLNNALSTGDPVQILKAVGDMARAQGAAKLCLAGRCAPREPLPRLCGKAAYFVPNGHESTSRA